MLFILCYAMENLLKHVCKSDAFALNCPKSQIIYLDIRHVNCLLKPNFLLQITYHVTFDIVSNHRIFYKIIRTDTIP